MNKEIINCLYNHFKNTPKKLKIVCDWDEVIQCLEPFALYLALKKTKSVSRGLEKLIEVINQNDFRKKVYQLCSQIPKGKVSTYKIIATAAYGSPNYAR
jgi:O6-methylguanine-DNA--protein-cysteine methyltransferase